MKAPFNFKNQILVFILLSICIFSSCNKKIDLKEFNKDDWRHDFNGCDGTRMELMQYLQLIQPDLIGIREPQLLEILGRPNKQELSERKKKSFMYYIYPGKQCVMNTADTRILVVDFDALDRVNLFSIKVE